MNILKRQHTRGNKGSSKEKKKEKLGVDGEKAAPNVENNQFEYNRPANQNKLRSFKTRER